MAWFEVAEVRGHLVNNKVAHWQMTAEPIILLYRLLADAILMVLLQHGVVLVSGS